MEARAIAKGLRIPPRKARLIIDFLKNGIGDYDTFRPVLRKRGPKIPNLVGDYLFEDNRTGERLR